VLLVDVQQPPFEAKQQVLPGEYLTAVFLGRAQVIKVQQLTNVRAQLLLDLIAFINVAVFVFGKLEAAVEVAVFTQDLEAEGMDGFNDDPGHSLLVELPLDLPGDAVVERTEQHPAGVGGET